MKGKQRIISYPHLTSHRMKPEASPFHNPVSACEASDAGHTNTPHISDPARVALHPSKQKVFTLIIL